jgi:putative tricarboxylic transport membrane protein
MEWLDTFLHILQPHILIYLVAGVVLGAAIGALPGLSATMGLAILTPLTFWFAPEQGFAMLLGLWNSAVWAGGLTAILINTPGTPASIATTFDGYALFKRGEGGLALGINVVYSVIGGLFSTCVLIFAAFPLAKFALRFGPPEYFALGLFGLSMMISISEHSILKGLIVGFAGLLVSTVGLDPLQAIQRFTLGNNHLLDGISFIPVMIGMFGIGEVLYQIFNNRSQVDQDEERQKVKNLKLGRVLVNTIEFLRLLPSTIMSCLVAAVVGAIPACGGDIASIICWGQAKRMSRKPEEFGKGSLEGLASTCTANNGVTGGAMTTMLTLGIPGDTGTAVMIGSLMMYSMQPGPRLFIENRPFVMNIMCLMIMANLVILIFGLVTTKLSAKVLMVKKESVWTAVTLLCVTGSFALNNSIFDVIIMTIAGVLGFFFKKMDFPPGPFILGLLLGKMVEANLRRSLVMSQGSIGIFFTKPITLVLLILIVLSLLVPIIKKFKQSSGNAC